MEKLKLMVDMDDVMVVNGFGPMVKEFLGYEIDFEKAGNNYYVQDLLGDKKDEFFKYFITKNLYDYVEINTDCYEVLEKLNDKYDIYICTDYIWRDVVEYAGDNLANKYNYLRGNFPFLDEKKFIFTADKSVINCDIKIDDRLRNLTGNCKMKLLFNERHNRDISKEELDSNKVTRVNSWKEIEKILLNI